MNVLGYVMPLSMTFGERALDAVTMLVKGMLMIFAVLTLLMLVLKLMARFFTEKKNAPKEAEMPLEEAAVPAKEEIYEDDGAVVAAITAAVSMVLAEEGSAKGGFRVVSFKRVGGKKSWNIR